MIWQAIEMDDDMGRMGVDLTMGMTAPLFLAMWIAMMVAMMFPAAAPMIVAFTQTQERKRQHGSESMPTWLFVLPYVVVWTVAGAIGYGIALAVAALADESMWAMENLPRIAGGALIVAGVYQLTPLKRVCLSRCRTPLSFMLSYWRDGRWGAVSLGLRHGMFCLGCCWALFLILLAVGVMNVGAMLAIAALVFAEKALPRGETIAVASSVVLVLYGVLALIEPDALPTTT